MTKSLQYSALGVALVAGLTAGYFLFSDDMVADPNNPELVSMGREVYSDYCASCHGVHLEGQSDWRSFKTDGSLPAPPHDKTGHTWHHPDEFLIAYTKHGGQAFAPPTFKSGMPSFGDALGHEKIISVIAYIKSLWPKAIQERQAHLNEVGTSSK